MKFLTWLIETYFPDQWVSAEDFNVVLERIHTFSYANHKLTLANAELNREMDELVTACLPVARKLIDEKTDVRTYTMKESQHRKVVFGADMKIAEEEIAMIGHRPLLEKIALHLAHKLASNFVAHRERTAR